MAKRRQRKSDRRPAVPEAVQTYVLTRSRRRCCMCYYLHGDLSEKKQGQTARLDHDRENNNPDNLAWLCAVPHHDHYDGKTSQTKNYTMAEVKYHRRVLYEFLDGGGLTAVVQAAPAEERRREVEAQRAEFEREVSQDRFHHFRSKAGVLAISIFPLIVPEMPVEQDAQNEQAIWRMIQPVGSGSSFDSVGHRFKALLCPERSQIPPQGLTVLKEDGTILSVLNLNYGRDGIADLSELTRDGKPTDFSVPYTVTMSVAHPQMLGAIRRYLNGLRSLGVDGPWYVGVSILKSRNIKLVPDPDYEWKTLGLKTLACEVEAMRADTHLIAGDADISTDTAVELQLRRPLKQLWSHCGHPAAPRYTRGTWEWAK